MRAWIICAAMWSFCSSAAREKPIADNRLGASGRRQTRIGRLEWNRLYRWVIVALGALMTCVAVGAMFSLAVFLDPLTHDTQWSRAGISSAMTINFIVMGLGAFMWGAISDRHGPRIVVLIGAVLLGLALVLASRAQSLIMFQLTYGIIVGLAASAFFAPMIATVTGWFETNRSLAVSLVSAGMGVAPLTISPFARWLITAYDWRTAMFIIGVGAWVLLVPAALFVRGAPRGAANANAPHAPSGPPKGAVARALRTPQFLVLGLTFFACCAAHSGPIFHMVSYAIICGITPMAAVSIYSVEGLAGLGGRVLLGVLADRIGVKPVLIAGLLVQAIAIGILSRRQRARPVLYAGGDVRRRLWRGHAALCNAGARIFRSGYHGLGVRRGDDAIEPRHGHRALGRRLDLRHLWRLCLDVHRLARRGTWCCGHSDRFSTLAEPAIAGGMNSLLRRFINALQEKLRGPNRQRSPPKFSAASPCNLRPKRAFGKYQTGEDGAGA